MKAERNSSVELLRILSMMTIVGVHYFGSCGTLKKITPDNSSYYFLQLTNLLLTYGVNIFVIITGYYMIGRPSVSIRKAFNLLWDIAFYGMLLFGVSILIGINTFSVSGFVKSVIPCLFGLRWFVKAYIILYLLIPFINRVVCTLDKRQYLTLLIICGFLFSAWSYLLPFPPVDDMGYGFTNFILIYLIAGYLKLHVPVLSSKWYWAVFAGCSVFLYITLIFKSGYPILASMNSMALAHNNPFLLMACFALFYLFLKKEFHIRWINLLASGAFAVYVIHGDFNTMGYLFQHIYNGNSFQQGWEWFPHLVVVVVTVYLGCFIIDYLFKHTVYKLFDRLFDRIGFLNRKITV